MKKRLALFLVIILIPTCSLADKLAEFTDQFGNHCSINDYNTYGTTYSILLNSLPYTFVYNGKDITLLRADTYQTIINHEYFPFFHLKFDVSQLTDSEIYWLSKDDMDYEIRLGKQWMSILVNTARTKNKFLKNTVKELDIILGCEHGSRTSYKGSDFWGWVDVKHSNSLNLQYSSNNYAINRTSLGWRVRPFSPKNLSDMESRTYRNLKNNLSKKGLELK